MLVAAVACVAIASRGSILVPVQWESTETEKDSGVKQTGRERGEGGRERRRESEGRVKPHLIPRGRDIGRDTQAATTGIVTVQGKYFVQWCVVMESVCVSSTWVVTWLTPARYSLR